MDWGFITTFAEKFGLEMYLAMIFFLIAKSYPKIKGYNDYKKTLKKEIIDTLFELYSNPKLYENRFIVEQVFENKLGKPISYRELQYIQNLVSPSEALDSYIKGRKHILFTIEENTPTFTKIFSDGKMRNLKKMWNTTWFFVFAMLGFAVIPLSVKLIEVINIYWYAGTLFLALYFLSIAYLCLMGIREIYAAEYFIKLVQFSDQHATKVGNKWYYAKI